MNKIIELSKQEIDTVGGSISKEEIESCLIVT